MNGKKAKRIRRHSRVLLVSWLKSLLSEEEAEQVNIKNYKQMMPEQTHAYVQDKFLLNAYHPKWIVKKINQLTSIYPKLKIEDVNLELIQWKANRSQG